MKIEILPTKHLKLSLEPDDDIENIRDYMLGDRWMGVFEQKFCNSEWGAVAPEWVCALTEAPIVTDDLDYDDDGTPHVRGNIWWYPQYERYDPIERLCETGSVIFTHAYDPHVEPAAPGA